MLLYLCVETNSKHILEILKEKNSLKFVTWSTKKKQKNYFDHFKKLKFKIEMNTKQIQNSKKYNTLIDFAKFLRENG